MRNAQEVARDRGYIGVVVAEEAALIMPANAYNNSHYWRPEIPPVVVAEVQRIDARTTDDTPEGAEIKGAIEALRAYGRISVREAQADRA